MNETILLALAFAVLVALEWHYRLNSVRGQKTRLRRTMASLPVHGARFISRDSQCTTRCVPPANRIGGLLLLTVVLGCQSPAAANPLGEWEQLLHLPGVRIPAFDVAPDGTLFHTTPTALFRALPERPDEWSLVTKTDRFVIALHALSRDRVLALIRYGAVHEWTAERGWSPVGDLPDSLHFVQGGAWRAFVLDWWIPNEREIYLAGQGGLLLHYDGRAWARVPADGLPALEWIQIDGDSSRIVLGGNEIWQRVGGTWAQLPRGTAEALQCGPSALVVRPTDLIIAGRWIANCLMRFERGEWRANHEEMRRFREHPFWGRLQPDGSVLIWSNSGDVARVDDTTVTRYGVPYFSESGGAALRNGVLYFGGTTGGDGLVGRIRQP